MWVSATSTILVESASVEGYLGKSEEPFNSKRFGRVLSAIKVQKRLHLPCRSVCVDRARAAFLAASFLCLHLRSCEERALSTLSWTFHLQRTLRFIFGRTSDSASMGKGGVAATFCEILIAILLPPLGVFLKYACGVSTWMFLASVFFLYAFDLCS